MSQDNFEGFPKMARLNRTMTITEKIDGTNAQVYFSEDMSSFMVGSRNRWISPESDNAGFARWAYENVEELRKLGPGRHFGEWWGRGIQRGYDLKEKRFSLFNTARWSDDSIRPACCGVVPVLYHGAFSTEVIHFQADCLRTTGSVAAPGFMRPEGIVVYHAAAGMSFKMTLEKDESPKSLENKSEKNA